VLKSRKFHAIFICFAVVVAVFFALQISLTFGLNASQPATAFANAEVSKSFLSAPLNSDSSDTLVNITLTGLKSVIYDSRVHHRAFIASVGSSELTSQQWEESGLSMRYRFYDNEISSQVEEPKDARLYTLLFSFTPGSGYSLGNIIEDGEVILNENATFEIMARHLTVHVAPLKINFGEAPNFSISYSGFPLGLGGELLEDESIFLPSEATVITENTASGSYKVKAGGISHLNYIIDFPEANFYINRTAFEIINGANKLILKGAFEYNTAVSFQAVNIDYERGENLRRLLKYDKKIMFDSDLAVAYDMFFTTGGRAGTTENPAPQDFSVTITGVKLSPFFVHKVAIIDDNGSFIEIKKFAINGGVLSFTSKSDGTVVVYRNSIWTYVVIGIISLVVFLVIVIKIMTVLLYRYQKDAPKRDALKKKKEDKERYIFD